MNSYIQKHDAAMEAYDLYESFVRKGQYSDASRSLVEALKLEMDAAQNVPSDLEPTRSVLFRSAASIALDAGRTRDARQMITEGLRGNPPSEIKDELLELLDERSFVHTSLVDPATILDRGILTKRLALQRASNDTSDQLSISTVAKVQGVWVDYFEPILEQAIGLAPRFEAIDAAIGSFAVQLVLPFSLDRKQQKIALDLLQDVGNFGDLGIDKSTPELARQSLARLGNLSALLATLRAERVRLDLQMRVVGEDRVVDVVIPPPSRRILRQLQDMLAGYVESADIPQADILDRVFALVQHVCRHGELPTPEGLGVVKRQIAYYRRAAEILGYLRDGTPTPIAKHIVRASAQQRLTHALHRFESSVVGSAWIEWAECSRLSEVEPSSALDFLSDVAIGLSPETIKRRSKTLRAWYETLNGVFDDE